MIQLERVGNLPHNHKRMMGKSGHKIKFDAWSTVWWTVESCFRQGHFWVTSTTCTRQIWWLLPVKADKWHHKNEHSPCRAPFTKLGNYNHGAWVASLISTLTQKKNNDGRNIIIPLLQNDFHPLSFSYWTQEKAKNCRASWTANLSGVQTQREWMKHKERGRIWSMHICVLGLESTKQSSDPFTAKLTVLKSGGSCIFASPATRQAESTILHVSNKLECVSEKKTWIKMKVFDWLKRERHVDVSMQFGMFMRYY